MTTCPCPECGATLTEREHAGIHVDRCTSCHGVWFDAGELKRFAQARGHRWVSEGAVVGYLEVLTSEALECPGCRALRLRLGESDGVELLGCAACKGIFLPSRSMDALGRLRTQRPTLGLVSRLDGSDLVALLDLVTDFF